MKVETLDIVIRHLKGITAALEAEQQPTAKMCDVNIVLIGNKPSISISIRLPLGSRCEYIDLDTMNAQENLSNFIEDEIKHLFADLPENEQRTIAQALISKLDEIHRQKKISKMVFQPVSRARKEAMY